MLRVNQEVGTIAGALSPAHGLWNAAVHLDRVTHLIWYDSSDDTELLAIRADGGIATILDGYAADRLKVSHQTVLADLVTITAKSVLEVDREAARRIKLFGAEQLVRSG